MGCVTAPSFVAMKQAPHLTVGTLACLSPRSFNQRLASPQRRFHHVPRGTVAASASQKVKESTLVKASKVAKVKKLGSQSAPPESPPAWDLLDLAQYNKPWQVTWGLGAVVAGMIAWGMSFVGLGLFVMPKLFIALGVDLRHGGPDVQASFILSCQAVQTLVGVGIIRAIVDHGRATAAAANGSPATTVVEDDLLHFSWRDPFTKPIGWGGWALLGVALSPVVVGTTALLLDALGYDRVVSGGRGTVDGVLPILQPDLVSFFSLLIVTGVLAPIMEETVFRGFLLPSLSRYMPTWTAVLVTAGFFGVAHLSIRDLPVLVALGTLLGFTYVRSRNLLTPIIIHGTWNSLVLSVLFYLSASGVNVQQLLKELSTS